MISLDQVHHTYRRWFAPDVPVLHGFSMEVPRGKVTGLIGPNGAGKTTVFRIMVGLEPISSGQVLVDGIDVMKEPERVRGRIAVLPEDIGMNRMMSGRQLLMEYGILHDIPVPEIKRRTEELIELHGLGSIIMRPGNTYSRGQKMRLALARMQLLDADAYILDEPTIGLDFESAHRLRVQLKRMAQAGKAILLATHILSDIELLCDRVVGLNDGKRVPEETVGEWMKTARTMSEEALS